MRREVESYDRNYYESVEEIKGLPNGTCVVIEDTGVAYCVDLEDDYTKTDDGLVSSLGDLIRWDVVESAFAEYAIYTENTEAEKEPATETLTETTTKVEMTKEKITMKNTIKEIRAAEAAAKAKAAEEAAKKARLDAIQPKDIVDTMDEVVNKEARAVRDENGNSKGTNGGLYLQDMVNGKIIGAKTQEELDAIKARMAEGVEGDGLLHKRLVIGGMPCDCVGSTEEELEEDIRKAEEYAKAHGLHILRDIDVAEQLVDADMKKEDLEQITASNQVDYILSYKDLCIMDLRGNTIVNLDNIKTALSKEDVKTVLVERLEAYIAENANNCPEDDYDDECECEDDDEYEDEEDCDHSCSDPFDEGYEEGAGDARHGRAHSHDTNPYDEDYEREAHDDWDTGYNEGYSDWEY